MPCPARRTCRATASCRVDDGLHALASHQPAREHQAGLDILKLKIRISGDYIGSRIAGGEHAEHMLHSYALAADNGLSAIDFWVDGDSCQKVRFGHKTPAPSFQGLGEV